MEWLNFHIDLPVTDPTWVFFLVLVIILFAPMIMGWLRIPHIVGMILAGVLVGNHGFNVLEYDSSFELFGKVGIYYIMFLAGLEMDLEGFKKNKGWSLLFGMLTTFIPAGIGFFVGLYWLKFGVLASALLACIFGSHTLVSYPIVIRYGLSRHTVVSVSIGGTMFALTVSLLVLAAIAGSANGEHNALFWCLFGVKCTVYLFFLFFFVQRIARAFFRRYDDNVMQYIFVLAIVFLSAALAELAGLEGIFGAFLAGLLLNRLVPHASPLMNRIEFVGNALFIPYFLIGVGMLINLGTLFNGGQTLFVVGVMLLVATGTKWMAAFATQILCGMNGVSRCLMFGLSNAHAAGALAMVMVGTRIELTPGQPLMNEDVLNGVVIMILVSCIISSLATENAARKMAVAADEGAQDISEKDEKTLILIENPNTVDDLVTMALMMRNPKSANELIALNVTCDGADRERKQTLGKKSLAKAARIAASADVPMRTQNRVSNNVASGVLHTLSESDSSDIVLGLHHKIGIVDSFFGNITTNVVKGTARQLTIVKCLIPVNTLRRIIVAVPENAEYEAGFYKWVERLCRLDEQLGCRIDFWASKETLRRISDYVRAKHNGARAEFSVLDSWDDLLLLTGKVNYDHLFVVVVARRGSISYQSSFEHLPEQIMRYFANNSLMVIYPDQFGEAQELVTFSEPRGVVEGRVYQILSHWIARWLKKNDN